MDTRTHSELAIRAVIRRGIAAENLETQDALAKVYSLFFLSWFVRSSNTQSLEKIASRAAGEAAVSREQEEGTESEAILEEEAVSPSGAVCAPAPERARCRVGLGKLCSNFSL